MMTLLLQWTIYHFLGEIDSLPATFPCRRGVFALWWRSWTPEIGTALPLNSKFSFIISSHFYSVHLGVTTRFSWVSFSKMRHDDIFPTYMYACVCASAWVSDSMQRRTTEGRGRCKLGEPRLRWFKLIHQFRNKWSTFNSARSECKS